MAAPSPSPADRVRALAARVAASPLAVIGVWALYALVGMCGAGALVMVACDGDAHPGRDSAATEAARAKAQAKAQAKTKAKNKGATEAATTTTPATPGDAEPTSPDRAWAAAMADSGRPPYQVYPDLGAAFAAILRDRPRVIGIGELHVRTDRPAPSVSALARFSSEVLPAIGDQVSDVVLETWMVDPACRKGQVATRQIESSMKRPASTKDELGGLFGAARARSITAHVMRLGCDDLAALTASGEVDAERLLGLVTRELDRVTRSAVRYRDEYHEARPLILVYGGALHNDLYPRPSTKEWSYALAVDDATGGRFTEVDLYAPELVEGDPLYTQEPWYPLVQDRGTRGVILIERISRSYLLILPRS